MPTIRWPCCANEAPCELHVSLSGKTTYLADPLRGRVEARAELEGVTVRGLLARAIAEYLTRRGA